VQPPFVAPPTDGTRQRRGWAIGLSIGAVAVVCALGVTAVIGIGVLLFQVVRDQAEATIGDYLTALRDREYDAAYELLCDDLQESTSLPEFVREIRDRPAVADFSVGEAVLDVEFEVPAQISYADGSRESVSFLMIQDPTTGGLEVCGEAD
jgi:hypothetical protein